MKTYSHIPRAARASGFSLFEVVLAVGVLSLSILALLGLFGPTMSSVRDVVDSNEANGVRTRLNAALMSDEIYQELNLNNPLTRFDDLAATLSDPTSGPRDPQFLYFWNERENLDDPVTLVYSKDASDLSMDSVEGSVFVVALEQGMQGGDRPYDFDPAKVQNQGYFPILVSIYPVSPSDLQNKTEAEFKTMVNTVEPVFSYTTAKLR